MDTMLCKDTAGGRCEPGGVLGRPSALEPRCSKSLRSQSEMQAHSLPPAVRFSGSGRGREPRSDKLQFYQPPGYLWDGGKAHRRTH